MPVDGAALLISALMSVWTGSAQEVQSKPAFEVASIKLNGPTADGVYIRGIVGGPGTSDPELIRYTGVTLKRLIILAYSIPNSQIQGPEWLDTERYDIIARVPPNTTKPDSLLMLQNLLVERFGLKAHREKKEISLYALVVAKGGPKVQEVRLEADRPLPGQGGVPSSSKTPLGGGAWRLILRYTRMSSLAENLSVEVGRKVVDQTGLSSHYRGTLEWEKVVPDSATDGLDAAGSLGVPRMSLFSALETQLGLKLQPSKGQVEHLVVDYVDKVPSPN